MKGHFFMKKCIIVGGAQIKDYNKIRKHLSQGFAIYCDGGLKHEEALSLKPDLIIGDFDSFKNPGRDIETIVLPCEKDDTDTFFAVKEAINRGFDEFTLIGVTGGRIDHTSGNLSMLLYLYENGKKAEIIDDYSVMKVVGKEPEYITDDFLYFSLNNISGVAKGVNVENAKYPLKNAEIKPSSALCVSNEVIKGEKAKVHINDGTMLLVKIDKE